MLLSAALAGCSNPDVAKRKHLEKGQRLAAVQQYSAAILEFRNALKIDPRYGEARFALAEALTHATVTPDTAVEAVRQYAAAAELLPDDFDAQLKAATFLLGAGDFERARQHASSAVRLKPRSADAQTVLAMSLAGMKDVTGALKQMREAVLLEPDTVRSYVNLGTLEASAGEADEAEAAFVRAVNLAPASPQANTALGYFYWSKGRLPEAEKALKAAASIEPYDRNANEYLALFYLLHGRADDAETPLLRLANQKDTDAQLMLADLYTQEHHPEKARSMLESLAAQPATRVAAIRRLAVLDYQNGRKEQARAAVDDLLKNVPNDADLLTVQASWAVKERRFDEALKLATAAVKARPGLAAAHYWLGAAQLSLRDTSAAADAFRETLRLDPNAVDAQVQLSRIMLAQGKPADALAYAEAARKKRSSTEIQADVVRALLAQQDLTHANTELAVLLKQEPDSPVTHTLNGQLLSARADLAGAAREFDRALQLDPSNNEALAGRLDVDAKQKRFPDGRARLAKALSDRPRDASLLVLAARFENASGDAAAAEQHLRKSLEVDPSNLSAYAALARLYFVQHRLEEAKTEYRQIAAQHPDQVAALTMVGIILEAQGRSDEASKVYEDIVKRAPRAAVAANNLAYHYAVKNEQLQMALQLAQTAKQEMPDSPDVDDTLGLVYYKQGLYTRAVDALERSVKSDPRNAVYLYHLGLAYAKAGAKAEARHSLQGALALRSDFDGAADARSVLAGLSK